ncbi:hypothetical protein QZH41_013121, partial [Actinostola sp. cb2023]
MSISSDLYFNSVHNSELKTYTMTDKSGYVHNISANQTSRKGNIRYFNFQFQSANDVFERGVCFHLPYREKLIRYSESGTPVNLRNVMRKPNLVNPAVDDVILNKRCKLEEANNADVQFKIETPEDSAAKPYTSEEAKGLDGEVVIDIKGRLTLDPTQIEIIERQPDNLKVLNAASVTDHSGSIKITLWNSDTHLTNEQCYQFKNVKVKDYNGKPIDENFPAGDSTTLDDEKSVKISNIEMDVIPYIH